MKIIERCSVDGCENHISLKQGKKLAMCNRHGLQMRRHGRITDKDKKNDEFPGEEWVKIKECSGYEVSNFGRVRSTLFGRKVVLKNLSKDGRVICGRDNRFRLHILVASSFHENPFGDTRVVFLDGDKSNCRADNIQWFSVYWHERAIDRLEQDGSPDAKAVLKFMRGDNNALNYLFAKSMKRLPGLIRYLLSFYRDIHGIKGYVDVDDVAQEACVKAMTAIRRGLMRDTSKLDAWVSKIARNALINHGKKQFYFGIDDIRSVRQRQRYA